MSLEALKREAAALPLDQRRHLMGFLVSINMADEERRELTRKIDDKDPERWMTLEQLDERLKALDEADEE